MKFLLFWFISGSIASIWGTWEDYRRGEDLTFLDLIRNTILVLYGPFLIIFVFVIFYIKDREWKEIVLIKGKKKED